MLRKRRILSYCSQRIWAYVWHYSMNADKGITEHIGVFYKRQRIQAKLGCLSPVAYEQQYYQRLI